VIQSIFVNNFYSLFTAPNKEEIFKGLKDAKVDTIASERICWNKKCNVNVEVLEGNEIGDLFVPSLKVFFEEIGTKVGKMEFCEIWRNTYHKGGHQEIHDHCNGSGEVDLSGCFFLEDVDKDGGRFYFYNRHASEVNLVWRKILSSFYSVDNMLTYDIMPKAGDVLLFPSYLLHGVTPHTLRKPRTTVTFNMKFLR